MINLYLNISIPGIRKNGLKSHKKSINRSKKNILYFLK